MNNNTNLQPLAWEIGNIANQLLAGKTDIKRSYKCKSIEKDRQLVSAAVKLAERTRNITPSLSMKVAQELVNNHDEELACVTSTKSASIDKPSYLVISDWKSTGDNSNPRQPINDRHLENMIKSTAKRLKIASANDAVPDFVITHNYTREKLER